MLDYAQYTQQAQTNIAPVQKSTLRTELETLVKRLEEFRDDIGRISDLVIYVDRPPQPGQTIPPTGPAPQPLYTLARKANELLGIAMAEFEHTRGQV